MLIADSLLQQHKPALITAIISDTDILYQEVFTPIIINLTDLCPTLLRPPIMWTPPFDFVPPLPPKVTSPVVTKNITTYFTLYSNTLLRGINCICELPLHHTATPKKNYASPTDMDIPPPLLPPPSANGKNISPFTSAVPPIHHTPQEAYIKVPPKACIISPLHETFDALLCSKNILEAITSMYHRFEISRSIPLPNIFTNFLLKYGPTQGSFLSTHIWDFILSGNLCASPL